MVGGYSNARANKASVDAFLTIHQLDKKKWEALVRSTRKDPFHDYNSR